MPPVIGPLRPDASNDSVGTQVRAGAAQQVDDSRGTHGLVVEQQVEIAIGLHEGYVEGRLSSRPAKPLAGRSGIEGLNACTPQPGKHIHAPEGGCRQLPAERPSVPADDSRLVVEGDLEIATREARLEGHRPDRRVL